MQSAIRGLGFFAWENPSETYRIPSRLQKTMGLYKEAPLVQKLRQSFWLKALWEGDLYLISSTTIVSILVYSKVPSLEVLNSELDQVKESFFLSNGPRMWPITNSWSSYWRQMKSYFQHRLMLRIVQREMVENEGRNSLPANPSSMLLNSIF